MLGLGRDNLHSTLVAWLKIILPLLALAVLSTLFMVSDKVSPDDAIPYATIDVADRLREPRLTSASFAGMTEDGATVTLKAGEARPGTAGTADSGSASALSGRIETPDGVVTDVTGQEARLDSAAQQVTISGGVAVQSTAGYRIETDSLTMSLDRTWLGSAGAVRASAPFGQISAGRLVLTRAAQGDYKLVFSAGVRLVYEPGNPGQGG